MGRGDANGKRIKWANWEKKLVKELKSQGLQLSRSVLEYRSRAEQLGKLPLQNPSENIEGDPMTTTIYEPVFYPVASSGCPSSSSQAGAQITPRVNSVIVLPGQDEKGEGERERWGDMSWSSDDDQAPSLGHMSVEEETEIQSEINEVDKIMAIDDLNSGQ